MTSTDRSWVAPLRKNSLPPGLIPARRAYCDNYRLYLERSENLANFHREIPATFMFDDHEILNDLWGAGTPGLKDGFWLWRDIGIRAFYDYLGWANYGEPPSPHPTAGSLLIFSRGTCEQGSNVLEDTQYDFSKLDLSQISTLLINRNQKNAGVYAITKVVDKDHLQLSHPCAADEEVDYSIGAEHYYQFTVSNSEFFIIDTRTNRTDHDYRDVYSKRYSLLGERQRRWLIDGISNSKARFIFVVSTVNWMFDHVNPNRPEKGESYSSFAWERDLLLDEFDKLDKQVFILTGDLHTSFVAQISDNVWEFASAPHNSDNHAVADSTYYPGGGSLASRNKKVKLKWGSRFVDELLPAEIEPGQTRRSVLHFPIYSVVQVNNAYKNHDFREDRDLWIAFDHPQVVVSYYNGLTGDLLYSEGISTADLWPIGEAPTPTAP